MRMFLCLVAGLYLSSCVGFTPTSYVMNDATISAGMTKDEMIQAAGPPEWCKRGLFGESCAYHDIFVFFRNDRIFDMQLRR